jgi:hypothetical protein
LFYETRYYETLMGRLGEGAPRFTMEHLRLRYARCGIERWLQLLVILGTMRLSKDAVQWFHDQVGGKKEKREKR